jgi:hypothetical protein
MAKATTITAPQVAKLLNNPQLTKIEKQVAKAVRSKVMDYAPEITIPENAKELALAGLDHAQVAALMAEHAKLMTAFSTALFHCEDGRPLEEEWNPAEGNQQDEDNEEEDMGLARGFSLSHLCYLKFLLVDQDAELLRFLKDWRVPKAKPYLGRLKKYYQQARAAA